MDAHTRGASTHVRVFYVTRVSRPRAWSSRGTAARAVASLARRPTMLAVRSSLALTRPAPLRAATKANNGALIMCVVLYFVAG